MSLVAYCASDDSEDSDIEDDTQKDNGTDVVQAVQLPKEESQRAKNGEISDSESDNDVRNEDYADDAVLNDKLRGTTIYYSAYRLTLNWNLSGHQALQCSIIKVVLFRENFYNFQGGDSPHPTPPATQLQNIFMVHLSTLHNALL